MKKFKIIETVKIYLNKDTKIKGNFNDLIHYEDRSIALGILYNSLKTMINEKMVNCWLKAGKNMNSKKYIFYQEYKAEPILKISNGKIHLVRNPNNKEINKNLKKFFTIFINKNFDNSTYYSIKNHNFYGNIYIHKFNQCTFDSKMTYNIKDPEKMNRLTRGLLVSLLINRIGFNIEMLSYLEKWILDGYSEFKNETYIIPKESKYQIVLMKNSVNFSGYQVGSINNMKDFFKYIKDTNSLSDFYLSENVVYLKDIKHYL